MPATLVAGGSYPRTTREGTDPARILAGAARRERMRLRTHAVSEAPRCNHAQRMLTIRDLRGC